MLFTCSSFRSLPAVAASSAVTFLLLALPAGLLPAQPDSATSTFLDRVEVDVVNVEVFVLDRQGRRVTDLGREDFELRVDGVPVELTNFYVATGPAEATGESARIAGLDTASVDPSPEAAPVEAAEPPPGDERPLHLTVYVDNVHILPSHRKRVLDELRPVVEERAAAGDPVMLLSYDGGVHVVEPFSRDREALLEGLDAMGRAATRGGMGALQRQIALRLARDALTREGAEAAEGVEGALAVNAMERVHDARGAYRALENTVRSLAGLPGRKALLYVSDGIPRRPGVAAEMMAGGDPGEVGARLKNDLSPMIREVVRQANAHQITLYTLDARGPSPSVYLSAEHGDVLGIGAGSGVVGADVDFAHDTNLRAPLLDMAHGTGGRAIFNTYELGHAFEGLVEDFETFYSLGFQSPSGGDGEYHHLDVRVQGSGLTVRHRAGYLDKTPAERVADRARSFLLQGWESNRMGVSLQFGTPEKKRRRWRVPALVRVPSDAVTLIPQGRRLVGEITLFVVVRDEEGRLSEVTELPHDISIPRAEAAKEGGPREMGYAVELELRSGLSNLMVAVWDELGGTESYLYQKVQVGG